jgi:hypothetical protein
VGERAGDTQGVDALDREPPSSRGTTGSTQHKSAGQNKPHRTKQHHTPVSVRLRLERNHDLGVSLGAQRATLQEGLAVEHAPAIHVQAGLQQDPDGHRPSMTATQPRRGEARGRHTDLKVVQGVRDKGQALPASHTRHGRQHTRTDLVQPVWVVKPYTSSAHCPTHYTSTYQNSSSNVSSVSGPTGTSVESTWASPRARQLTPNSKGWGGQEGPRPPPHTTHPTHTLPLHLPLSLSLSSTQFRLLPTFRSGFSTLATRDAVWLLEVFRSDCRNKNWRLRFEG